MNGRNIVISWGLGTIGSTKTDKITIDGETMEIAAAVAQFKERIAGAKSWSLTTDFLIVTGGEFNATQSIGSNVDIVVFDDNNVPRLMGQATMVGFDGQLARGSLAAGAITFLGNGPLRVPVTGITLNPPFLSMGYDESRNIVATVVPAAATDKTLQWQSTDTEVALVSQSGVVTARMAGTCNIIVTALYGVGVSAMCPVSVFDVPVTGLTVSPASLDLRVDDTATLVATVTPSNAGDTSVTWESSDVGVAEVNQQGVVTAIGVGECDIICIANGNTAIRTTCPVRVEGPIVLVTGIEIQPPTLFLEIGESAQLQAIITPSNAANKQVAWSIYDQGIASITQNGYVTGLAHGHTAIFATAQDGSGVTAQINIVV